MKIHIIGCSGSGKTYLAKALSKKYNTPHFDLDDIQWDNNAGGYGVKMPVEKRTELLNDILKNDSWIIEGVYYTWVGRCFENADKIFVLDMPKRIYICRIIKRTIKRKLGLEKGKKESLKSVYNLLKWTNTFQNKSMVEIRKILSAYPEKTIWLKTSKDVQEIINGNFNAQNITAETDDDAIGFYKKYGFAVADINNKCDTKRYVCLCESVTHHYDLLIDENNDPVHDPKPLRDYMDKWDGQGFIDSMKLDNEKSVLEIGVGTGRLAVRVALFCGEFYGVDISSKTIERAKENLDELENVRLTCADFLSYEFGRAFDVVYSSLTFMHIEDKQRAVNKIAGLLNDAGRFVLSIDKNPSEFIDTGTRKIRIFPDTLVEMAECIRDTGLTILNQYDTEFATIFVAQKG